jgi:hypothetical protein
MSGILMHIKKPEFYLDLKNTIFLMTRLKIINSIVLFKQIQQNDKRLSNAKRKTIQSFQFWLIFSYSDK